MGAVRLVARVGDLELTETTGTHTEAPPPRIVSARWVDELEEGAWPAPVAPPSGTLQVVLERASDAADIGPTTPVALEVFTPPEAATPVASFYGRASDPIITPHDLGVLVTLNLSDYLVDLDGYTIGAADYPAERTPERLGRAFSAVGEPFPEADIPPLFMGWWPELAAREADPVSLLAYARQVLSWSVEHARTLVGGLWSHQLNLYELRPNVTDGALDATEPWVLAELPNFTPWYPTPGTLTEVDGVWYAELDPALIVSAQVLEFSSTWGRRRVSAPNLVTVTEANGNTVTASSRGPGEPPIRHLVETRLSPADPDSTDEGTADPARDLAMVLVGVSGGHFGVARGGAVGGGWTFPVDGLPVPGWETDKFRAHVDRAPDGWWPGDLRDVRLVTDLPARHNPEDSDRWPGVIVSRETLLEAGHCVVELRMAARPLDNPPEALTWQTIPAEVTWENLDPDATWRDINYVAAPAD